MIGDVRKLTELRLATRDVTTVIHAAGLVSFGTFPADTAMNDVNTKGLRPLDGVFTGRTVPRTL